MEHLGTAPAATAAVAPQSDSRVNALIALVAATAAAVFAASAADTVHAISAHTTGFLGMLAVTLVLQLKVIEVPDEGAVSFASIGMLAAGFAFGVGPAMAIAAASAVVRVIAVRGRLDRGIFDVGTLALASAAAAGTSHLVTHLDQQPNDRFGPSVFAAAAFLLVNMGLLCVAMGMSDGESPFQVWKRRFRWMTPWALASGPFAAVAVVVWESMGVLGIVAVAIAPFALVAPVRKRMLWSE